jgi:hypothetical protein
MIWFGSSAGVALSNQFPEAKSALGCVAAARLAYVVGFFVMLSVLGWHPDVKRRAACDCIPAAMSLSALRANPHSAAPPKRAKVPSSIAPTLASGNVHDNFTRSS